MSRVAYSRKGSLIFYIDDIEIGSYGYAIDYTKGDSSRGVSCQCKIKVVEYMVFGTESNSKKYFMNLGFKYPSKLYKRFVSLSRRFLNIFNLLCRLLCHPSGTTAVCSHY